MKLPPNEGMVNGVIDVLWYITSKVIFWFEIPVVEFKNTIYYP